MSKFKPTHTIQVKVIPPGVHPESSATRVEFPFSIDYDQGEYQIESSELEKHFTKLPPQLPTAVGSSIKSAVFGFLLKIKRDPMCVPEWVAADCTEQAYAEDVILTAPWITVFDAEDVSQQDVTNEVPTTTPAGPTTQPGQYYMTAGGPSAGYTRVKGVGNAYGSPGGNGGSFQ